MTPEAQARREWAKAMLARCPEGWPSYGTPEWCALADGSAAKVAAVVASAEAWAYDGDILELEQASRARWLNHLHGEAVAEHQAEYGNKSYKPHPTNREVA